MNDLWDDDTTPTEDDGLLDQLRRDGVLGPFRVSDWAGDTDTGTVRPENEDTWRAVDGLLFVAADGVGGHAGGALAATTATEVLIAHGVDLTEARAGELAARANSAVVAAGAAAGTPRLGTTAVMLAVHRNHVVVMSVGDSRAYRSRDGDLELLTRDHTVRDELIASGVPIEAAERSNIRLDALTAYLGRNIERPVVHAASYSVMAGDRFLLCTDGVHGQIDEHRITEALLGATCADAVAGLLRAARGEGGRDNATAVVIEFQRAEEEA